MFKMKSIAAAGLVLIITAISARAQNQNPPDAQTSAPDAKAVLKQIGDTYRNLKGYHFEGRYTSNQKTESMGMKDESKREEAFVLAAIKPGRSRIESKNPNYGVIVVSDGKTKWDYVPEMNEYSKKAAGAESERATAASPAVAPLTAFARAIHVIDGYGRFTDRVKDARFIGEETLTVEGQRINCTVIGVDNAPASAGDQSTQSSRKLWIDKARKIVLREVFHVKNRMKWGSVVETTMTYDFTVARLNEQVSESLFAFAPPEGAKEVAELASPFRRPAPANWAGKDAPAFALKDLDGNQVDLQSFKGKVVLLDFWASWCGPCVAELPHIEKLHKDFKDKGLVVLGIDNEEVEVAKAFLKEKGYTFTSLVDEGRTVATQYEVTGIPQVFIINREGKVKWHVLGYGPGKEVELRNAVEKVLNGEDPPAPIEGGAAMQTIASARMITVSGGVLSGSATKKVQPPYPPQAKEAGAQGVVQVQITVSEAGKVIEAKAISGHEALRDAAVQAAKQWEFKPTELSGAPVKVQGVLTFNFTLQ
jgi:TonB family protein